MYAINSIDGSLDFVASFDDPRLVSAGHSGQRLTLDAPPLNGTVKMSDVYGVRPGYRTVYDSLADVGAGQIRYYYDGRLGVPFIEPLFDATPVVLKENYVDPMGSYKPHYYRNRYDVSGCGLTWLADTQLHREDILAANRWRRNQTEPLWKNQRDWSPMPVLGRG